MSAAAVVALPLLATTPETASAQESEADDRNVLEEIIVRARRREESLQSTPVSVAAFTGETIERAGMFTAFDVANRTPSVLLVHQSAAEPELFIRGAGTDIESAAANNAVGFFVDDVHLARGGASLADLYDIQRVEILRGPQSTYYGKNVSGGAINYITNKPSQDTDARVSLEIGNGNHVRVQGMANGALSERISGRFAFNTRDRDGWTTNIHTGNTMDDISVTAYRASLLFEASADLSLMFMVDSYTKRGGSLPNKLVKATDPNEQIFITPDPRTQFSSVDGHEPMDSESYTMKIEWETGLGVLSSLSNYRDTYYDWNQNSTGNLYPDGILYEMAAQIWFSAEDGRCSTPGGFGTFGNCWASFNQTDGDGRGGIYFEQTTKEDVEQWSQEFRLASDNDGGFNWMGGVFFANENIYREDISKYAIRFGPGTPDPFCCGPGNNIFGSWNEGTEFIGGTVDTDIFGAFVELGFSLSDNLTLTVSSRYSLDEKTFTANKAGRLLNACQCTTDPDGNPTAVPWGQIPSEEWVANPGTPTLDDFGGEVVPIKFGDSDEWDNISSRVSLDWQVSDGTFLYFLVSEGYKGGGWEGRAASGQSFLNETRFEEETAVNYEVGLRADFWDRRARVNITTFFTDYDDLQISLLIPVFDPGSGEVIDSKAFTTNVGSAEAKGAEIEFTFLPWDGMNISGSYGYLSTEIKDDIIYVADPSPEGIENWNGNELARSPENSFNLNAGYTWDMAGGGSSSLAVEYNYTAGNWVTNRNHLFMPSQDFIDANFRYISSDGQWQFMLWGRNITDELVLANLVFSGDVTEQFDTVLHYHDYADPRTYGVTFTWNYQ